MAGDEGQHATSPTRVALGILAGAGVGGALVTAQWLRAAVQTFGAAFVAQVGARGAAIVAVGAFVSWLAGLLLIGGPAWWLLHRHRLRGWRAAVLSGMALTFVAGMVLAIPVGSKGGSYSSADRGGMLVVDNHLTAHGWAEAAGRAALLAFVGGGVAFIVWRVAYRGEGSRREA
ncbi:MAG: hypothetical protein ACREEB_12680 [Caulobacteraceae bacterium]